MLTSMRDEAKSADVDLLYRVARALLSDRDYGELLSELLDVTITGFGADRGFVVVRDAHQFRAVAARHFRSDALATAEHEISASIASAVIAEGRTVLIDNAQQAERFRDNASVQRMALRSVLCGPLIASDEAFALLYLENRDLANRFTEHHRAALDEICTLAAPRLRVAVAMEHARRRAAHEATFSESDGFVTADPGMLAVLRTVRQVAPTDLPVLVQGETGTGKELIARALYRHSARANGPFVVLNCAAIPAGLIESELFGYVRGAFTGATRDHLGLIATADHGTLFLDEIGEMPAELQPRFLRVLQSGEFMRLGSTRGEIADVRVIAATNRDLQREVEEGRFRADLFYRLATITIHLPSLRDREGDVHLLVDRFLRSYATRFARPVPQVDNEALAALARYSFPGNVRELESEIARLVAITPPDTTITKTLLNDRIRHAPPVRTSDASAGDAVIPPMSLDEMEKRLIRSVLASTNGNRTRAADVLGISREGLRTKMQRLGLSDATGPPQDK